MAALLALVSSLMWGSADFLGGSTSRRLPALAVYGLSQVVGLVALLIVVTVYWSWDDDPGYWPYAIGASLLGLVSMVAFYRALALGPMGIVSPLVSLGVLVPIVVGLVGGDRPGGVELLGIGLALAGILLASGPELTGAESARPLLLATLAALAFGGMFVLMAQGSAHSPLMTMTGMRITTVVLMAAVWMRVRSFGGAGRADIPVLVGIGLLDVAANVTYGYATTMGLLTTVSVLGNLYPVVTAVLAALVLRERLRPIQYVGVTVAISGVLAISAAM